MKQNKTKIYAAALADVILKRSVATKNAATDQAVAKNFVQLLEKAGLQKQAGKILAETEDILLVKHGKRKIVFETARKMTEGQKKMVGSIAKKGDTIIEKINPEIIAGIKIIINDAKQFDASMRTKLQNLNI